jgi:hypothetical protein
MTDKQITLNQIEALEEFYASTKILYDEDLTF